jgi:hypothetical protein
VHKGHVVVLGIYIFIYIYNGIYIVSVHSCISTLSPLQPAVPWPPETHSSETDCWVSEQIVFNPTPNHQPGGPGYPFSPESPPLTCPHCRPYQYHTVQTDPTSTTRYRQTLPVPHGTDRPYQYHTVLPAQLWVHMTTQTASLRLSENAVGRFYCVCVLTEGEVANGTL